MNSTTEACPTNVPGLWHNGDCSLLCRPTEWYDILIFFLGNYLAHVATVVSPPGASLTSKMLGMLGALLLPFSGIGLGLEAIASMAIRGPTPLRTAARAGALLMIVPTSEKVAPDPSGAQAAVAEITEIEGPKECADVEQNTNPTLPIRPYRPWTDEKIHGNISLPEGYEFKSVSRYATFEDDEEEVRCKRKDSGKASKWYDVLFVFSKRERTAKEIACSYNGAKAIVSIIQTLFGIYTLYRTKGNQIEQFGFAAYGLTVAPYALMSIINLAGNLLRPEYPFMYIVGSRSLDDFQTRYKCTVVTVGRIDESKPESDVDENQLGGFELTQGLGFLVLITIMLLIIGLMTGFTKGQSTLAQRVWIMAWLAFGAFYGFQVHVPQWKSGFATAFGNRLSIRLTGLSYPPPKLPGSRIDSLVLDEDFVQLFMILPFSVPTFGGFVVVAQMIKQYGVCSKILDVGV